MKNNLITKIYNFNHQDYKINFTDDAFINVTQIAKDFSKIQGKRRDVSEFLSNKQTKEYIDALIESLNERNGNYRNVTTSSDLIIIKQGGIPEQQGTWLHPKLAILFARWLDARFAIWCDLQIEEILKSQSENLSPKITDKHYKISLAIAKTTSELLRLSDTSNLKMMEKICGIYKVDSSFLPIYVEQQPVTNLTQLLKEFNLHHFSAKELNPILEQLGILEKISRRSTKSESGTTTFWSLTSKGLEFGKNEASPQNPRETQPLYFREKFQQLIELIEKG